MTPGDAKCRLILRILGCAFAFFGLLFLFASDFVVSSTNSIGHLFGTYQAAPTSELRIWVSLSFAYMSIVTVLAFLAASDPHRYLHLLPILALGKITSSLSGLGFFLAGRRCFLYLATFIVDGSITLLVLAVFLYYLRQPAATPSPAPGGSGG